jgi:hypothetical protein
MINKRRRLFIWYGTRKKYDLFFDRTYRCLNTPKKCYPSKFQRNSQKIKNCVTWFETRKWIPSDQITIFLHAILSRFDGPLAYFLFGLILLLAYQGQNRSFSFSCDHSTEPKWQIISHIMFYFYFWIIRTHFPKYFLDGHKNVDCLNHTRPGLWVAVPIW